MPRSPQLHPALVGFDCIQCGTRHPIADHPIGCPSCAAAGRPASVVAAYGEPAPPGEVQQPFVEPVTLGEGGTPLLEHSGPEGLTMLLKWEGANPTGSHKDRFSAVAVTRALTAGYATVAAASSGNAGVSLAAYCARAGLRCEVAVTEDTPAAVLRLMRDFGAEVVTFRHAEDRWHHLSRHAGSRDRLPVTNFTVPPVGSSAFGVEGYKLIAAELAAALPAAPHWVVVPASRGDLAWGVHRGLVEVYGTAAPRICLVEPFPRVARVLAGADLRGRFPGRTGVMPSLAGDTVAVQAVQAVRLSGGHAEVVRDDAVVAETRRLWRAGLPLEPSSAAGVLAAVRAAGAGVIRRGETVVVLATAHGLKGM
jgi:threonine synthase